MTIASVVPQLPEYNGWENFPSWSVASWLGSTEVLYDEGCQLVADATSPHDAANTIKEWVEALIHPESDGAPSWVGEAGIATDLLDWAVRFVDWPAIVRHLTPR